MTWTAERSDARSRREEEPEPLFGGAFPAFITADQVTKKYIGRVREWFPDLNIILIDEDEVPVAAGWGVPIRWDRQVGDLPGGYADTLRLAVEGRERGDTPDALVICGGIVSPALQGQGLAGELITALRDLAPAVGLNHIIAPVRPTLKGSTRSTRSRAGNDPTVPRSTRGCAPTGGSAAKSSLPHPDRRR